MTSGKKTAYHVGDAGRENFASPTLRPRPHIKRFFANAQNDTKNSIGMSQKSIVPAPRGSIRGDDWETSARGFARRTFRRYDEVKRFFALLRMTGGG